MMYSSRLTRSSSTEDFSNVGQQQQVLRPSFLLALLQDNNSSAILSAATAGGNLNRVGSISSTFTNQHRPCYSIHPSVHTVNQLATGMPTTASSDYQGNLLDMVLCLSRSNHPQKKVPGTLQQRYLNNARVASSTSSTAGTCGSPILLSIRRLEYQRQQQEQQQRAAIYANHTQVAARELAAEWDAREKVILSQRRELIKSVLRKAELNVDLIATISKPPAKAPLATTCNATRTSRVPSSSPITTTEDSASSSGGCENDVLREKYSDINEHSLLWTLGSTCLERRLNKIPYFDASILQDPNPIVVANRGARGGVSEPFPEKLYRMLMVSSIQGHEDIVSFHPHGRAFSIHKAERFVTEIMPNYFRHSRLLSSFQRQLNLYGFARVNSGPDTGGYYHELFLRGRPALGSHIQRVGVPTSVPRKRGAKAHKSSIDPDFYALPDIRMMPVLSRSYYSSTRTAANMRVTGEER